MNILLLAAGRGERLSFYSSDCNKCALPISDGYVIDHPLRSISTALKQGYINKVVVVIGYKADTVIDKVSRWYYEGAKKYLYDLYFVNQKKQGSMLDAISLAKDELKDDDFVLLLGDEIIPHPDPIGKMVTKFQDPHCKGVIGYIYADKPSRVSKTFSIESRAVPLGKSYFRFKEKPLIPTTRYMGTGHGVFDPDFFNCINGCYNYPEALTKYCHMKRDGIVELCLLGCTYFNINTEEDYNEAKRFVEYTHWGC